MTYNRYGEQYRWQFFQVLSFAGGPTQRESARDRFTLFPLYFQQRSSDPSENYTAVFPFYGHLKHRLFRDEIFFVMFPLYSQTRKKDVVTDNYVWPFFRSPPRRRPARLAVLAAGRERTQRRHHPDQRLRRRQNHRRARQLLRALAAVLQRHEAGSAPPTSSGSRRPFPPTACCVRRCGTRPPLSGRSSITWMTGRRNTANGMRRGRSSCSRAAKARPPRASGPSTATRTTTTLESDFYLWPIYKYNRVHSAPLDSRRTRICFFLYSDLTEKNTETEAARRRVDFWPFFTHRRDFNGNSRLQVAAPCSNRSCPRARASSAITRRSGRSGVPRRIRGPAPPANRCCGTCIGTKPRPLPKNARSCSGFSSINPVPKASVCVCSIFLWARREPAGEGAQPAPAKTE